VYPESAIALEISVFTQPKTIGQGGVEVVTHDEVIGMQSGFALGFGLSSRGWVASFELQKI
jgi:hypothetical protein